jgi:Domain of unknown function (DUF4032)/Lipopolysaccharide kinase (Kdo/WaaP) family
VALHIMATRPLPGLVTLPWEKPLESWQGSFMLDLPRGLSRHIVRFIRVGPDSLAVKETREPIAWAEYRLLRDLGRIDAPAVQPLGIVTGREDIHDEPLEPVLVTRHLEASIPYRELFSRGVRAETATRLIDALVVLLVRLHAIGFYWGDCSLSNTLFRRAAGEFSAYLVDAETGELHPTLSNGQRSYDLDIAISNLFAEMLDLQAGGFLDENLDALELAQSLRGRYEALWAELTSPEEFGTEEMWRIEQRINRLNDLGFEVDELDIVTDWDGATIRIQPKVVEAGHHRRRLQSLTGLDVEENQARRLLNDLDAFTAAHELQGESPAVVAHRWLVDVYEPVVARVPPDVRGDRTPPEVFHEILEHRWYLSERGKGEVDILTAADDYAKSLAKGVIPVS